MKLGDLHFVNDVLSVNLWYPNVPDDPNCPRTMDHPKVVEVGLVHVRAADSIRIEYDFARDGYVIKQASKFEWAIDDTVCDGDWQEVAFVQAWAREVEPDVSKDAAVKPLNQPEAALAARLDAPTIRACAAALGASGDYYIEQAEGWLLQHFDLCEPPPALKDGVHG